jgi:hypothetical protein
MWDITIYLRVEKKRRERKKERDVGVFYIKGREEEEK